MKLILLIVLTLGLVKNPCDGGFIKKIVGGIIGGGETTTQSYGNERDLSYNNWQSGNYQQRPGGSQGYKNTSAHIVDGDYLTPNGNGNYNNQRPNNEYGGGGTYNKQPSSSQSYKNTTSHIVDGDYLTPNGNENHNNQRPNNEYGGGGSYNKKPSSSQPYKNTTAHIVDEDYLTPNPGNESITHQQRPSTGYGGGGSYEIKPSTSQNHQTQRSESTNFNPTGSYVTQRTGMDNQTPRQNTITLHSDSITCLYSNINQQSVENRQLNCNDTNCRLEKDSEKSSLWVCNDIKCTVANVDFTTDVSGKRLMECTMDARNIIQVQDKPKRCGPDEKEHNGRCRKVFGS